MNYFTKNIWIRRIRNFDLSYANIIIIITLSLLATATEVFGIGMFLPIFQFIRLEGDISALVSDSIVWKNIIELFIYFNVTPSLLILLFLSFTFFIARQIFTFLRLLYFATVSQRLVQRQRNRLFDKYIDADTTYHDSIPVGNLSNVIISEVQSAVVGVMTPLDLAVYFIMLIGYLILLSMLSLKMTLLSIVVIALAAIIPKFWIKQSAKTGRKLVNANLSMSEFLIGRLRSPRLVRLSGTESAEKNEFHSLTLRQRKHQITSSVLHLKTDVAVEPFVIALSLAFLYFSYTVLHLQVEIIGMYLVIVMRLMPLIKTIIISLQSIYSALGPIEVLEDRFKVMSNAKEDKSGTKILNHFNHSVLIEKVSYRYPANKDNALNDITINIKANDMMAIVGPSGGGKSTLIDLLPRLRLPTSGDIKIDGKSIAEYKLEDLRRLMSYAPQFPQIFNGTVKNHILYGKTDATDEEVKSAIRIAGAEDFINRLPQGLETVIGEDAVKLSGGQRQRLDLARALIRKAAILILDEPTSNLDAESEGIFKKSLSVIRKDTNTTVIIISHRLAGIADADQIVILNQGRVEATGVHAELLKQNGWYAKAWMAQKSTDNE
jgi:ABC-type multidrug transport system fused ATPase/permease subunit